MKTAEIIEKDGEQFIILPPKFQFEGDSVYIEKAGNSVILYPYNKKLWQSFDEALETFPDDFMAERNQPAWD